jgi:antitoxin HicB
MRTVQDYLSLPYTIVLRPDEDGDMVARIAELPGCVTHAASEAEAVANLREVQRAWIEQALRTNVPIPEPVTEEVLPSGKWLQRVPRTLHAKLVALARIERVSLNQLVTSLLSQAIGNKRVTESRLMTGTDVDPMEISHVFLRGSPDYLVMRTRVWTQDEADSTADTMTSLNSPTASTARFVSLSNRGEHGVS